MGSGGTGARVWQFVSYQALRDRCLDLGSGRCPCFSTRTCRQLCQALSIVVTMKNRSRATRDQASAMAPAQAIEPGGLAKGGDIEVELRRVGQKHRVQRRPGVSRADGVDIIEAHRTANRPGQRNLSGKAQVQRGLRPVGLPGAVNPFRWQRLGKVKAKLRPAAQGHVR